jgi:hypothetical protein
VIAPEDFDRAAEEIAWELVLKAHYAGGDPAKAWLEGTRRKEEDVRG